MIQLVSSGDEIIFNYAKDKSGFHLDADKVSELIYTSVAFLLLVIFVQALIKIFG